MKTSDTIFDCLKILWWRYVGRLMMHNYFKKIALVCVCFFSVALEANIFKKFEKVSSIFREKGWTISYVSTPDLQADTNSKLDAMVEHLCQKLEMVKPLVRFYTAKNKRLEYNLFASFADGNWNKPAIGIGMLLGKRWEEGWLTDQEIEACVAHELCHLLKSHPLKNGVFNIVVDGPGIFNISLPIFGPRMFAKNALARKHEKEADLKAIKVLDDPMNLATGLVKLHCLGANSPATKEEFDAAYKRTMEEIKENKLGALAHVVEIFSDHPLTIHRIEYIEKSK